LKLNFVKAYDIPWDFFFQVMGRIGIIFKFISMVEILFLGVEVANPKPLINLNNILEL
jgi:hypothetical protein